MDYEKLLSRGLIKPFKVSSSQIRNRMEIAKRDIKAARATMAHDRDLGIGNCRLPWSDVI